MSGSRRKENSNARGSILNAGKIQQVRARQLESGYRVILAHQYGIANMSEQRSSEWLSIDEG
jgi:hypothetical protein